MEYLSQRDRRWKNLTLGGCTDTIAQSGCVITCLAMLCGSTPDVINSTLIKENGYEYGCVVDWVPACKILGLEWSDDLSHPTHFPTIAWTDHWKPKVPQHFFIDLGNGEIIDPLDGLKKKNPYNIKGYRNVKGMQYEYIMQHTGPLVRVEGDDTVYMVTPLTGEAFLAIKGDFNNVQLIKPWQFINNANPAEVSKVLYEVNKEKEDLQRDLAIAQGKPVPEPTVVTVTDPAGEEAVQQVGVIKSFIQLISKWFKS
jgi:hypothetical protein